MAKKEQTTKTKLEIEQEIKEKNLYKDFESKPNRKTIVCLLLVLVGYIFFFSSPTIFHQEPDFQYTKLNETINLNDDDNGTVKIDSWTYSKKKDIMEVQLTVDNNESDQNFDFAFYADCNYTAKDKGNVKLPTKTIINTPDFIVVWIGKVPKDFYTVRLSFTCDDGETKDDGTKIYTNVSKVKSVKSIEEQDVLNYQIGRIERKISDNEKSITKNNEKIQSLKDENDSINERIDEIKSSQLYQTDDEKLDSNQEITNCKNEITSNKNTIQGYEIKNSSLNDDINEYKELIENLKKGKV